MAPETDYIYDVCVSYTRDHPVGTWVKERFLWDFAGYLGEELGYRARVFFDEHEIAAGEDWEQKLRWALRVSRVLVAVCSARYFYDSRYCQMEWNTFGDVSVEGASIRRPRIPLRYNDGNSFPPEARAIQQIDFSDSNSIIEAFYKNDARAIKYEDNIRKLAMAVAKSINEAPPFTAGFPVFNPLEQPLRRMQQPRL